MSRTPAQIGPKEAKLRLRAIEEILQEWDPIGVIETLKEDGLPPNEYDTYAPGVFQQLVYGKTAKEIAEYLGSLEITNMGFKGPDQEKNLRIAERLKAYWSSRT